MSKEDIDYQEGIQEDIYYVRLALSAYHTKTVYPGCVEAFERIVKGVEMPTPMTIGMEAALDIVNEQAEDNGLWFDAKYASEAYLQKELRRLHAAVELAALQSPRVPVIDAITEKIYDAVRLADKEYDGIHEGTIGTTRKEYTKKAIARAYAELQKGN